ncbi:MAG TPA: chemotaxis protein CheW [Chroococcidiopsis sp.]
MSQSNLLHQAKQGDPSAIATLIGKRLSARGITVNANRTDTALEIWIDGKLVPDEEYILNYVRRGFESLQADSIQQIVLHGRGAGTSIPSWTQVINLKPPNPSQRLPPPSASARQFTPPLPSALPAEPVPSVQPTPIERLPASTDLASPSAVLFAAQSAAPSALLPSAPAPFIEAWLEQGLAIAPTLPTEAHSQPSPTIRLLRFRLGDDQSALLPLPVIKQVWTVRLSEILPVPHVSPCVVGVYNYRGEILWMVDLAAQIGLRRDLDKNAELTMPSVITAIALQIEDDSLGLVVPNIFDIEEHHPNQIQAPSQGLFSEHTLPFIAGCLLQSRGIVLDASALLNDPQLQVHSMHL